MSNDPLDVFNNLDSKIGRHMKEEKDFPGNTAPRNRGVVTPIRIEHDWLKQLRSSEYQVNGVTKRFYTVGELGRALKRKAVTIRSWEAKGWLPPAMFRTPPPQGEQLPGKAVKGRRLYSEAQVVFLFEAAVRFSIDDVHNPDWEGFRQHISDKYPRH